MLAINGDPIKKVIVVGATLMFKAFLFAVLLTPRVFAGPQYVTIGTGGVTGVYYPTGSAVAKLINNAYSPRIVRASAESTGGSVYNVNAVLSGDLDFAIVQSDRQYQAFNGLKNWQKRGKQLMLRSMFSLYPEVITLVVAADSGIMTVGDLQGKRVNIGNHGSGHRGNALDVLLMAGLNPYRDLKIESLKASEAPIMLQDNRIDAFFYTVGHPSGAITEATSGKRRVRFVPIIDSFNYFLKFNYYARVEIPVAFYPRVDNVENVTSIGLLATFVTTATTPEDVVYLVTKAVFSHLNRLKRLHPALSILKRKDMLKGLSAPLHRGAKRYFHEIGFIL